MLAGERGLHPPVTSQKPLKISISLKESIQPAGEIFSHSLFGQTQERTSIFVRSVTRLTQSYTKWKSVTIFNRTKCETRERDPNLLLGESTEHL